MPIANANEAWKRYRGGTTSADPPEGATLTGHVAYNPRFITPIPAYGLFVRHAREVRLQDVTFTIGAPDERPALVARDVSGLLLDAVTVQKASGPALQLEAVTNLAIRKSTPLKDVTLPAVGKTTL